MNAAPRSLCLNMIVRNEAAILSRALRSVVDHIAYWVICDTGSSDGTGELIQSFFAARNIPGELHSFAFENFEQARNQALDRSRTSKGEFDYLLLMDADMELVVNDLDFRQGLNAPAYRLLQNAGISYWNTRMLRRGTLARYHGVTHEYLDRLPEEEALHSIWFRDHADGGNRPDKLERDIRLLEEALARDPSNGRYVFYLAQSYRDAGRLAEASETFARRVSMGGWDEETWYAQLQEARCRLALGDDDAFVSTATKAADLRPHRAEPLYELAKFHRQRGLNETAMLFNERASTLSWPNQDTLFIEDFVYDFGIREEVSIAGFYSTMPGRQDAGRRACFDLSTDRQAPAASVALARHNQIYYARSGDFILPSLRTWPMPFRPPDGSNAMNPSVAVWNDVIYSLVRGINYEVTEAGHYIVARDGPIETRNYLLRLNAELHPEAWSEVRPPFDLPRRLFPKVRGFEDSRLFVRDDALWCSSTFRELTDEGWCEIVLARIDHPFTDACALTDWRILEPDGARRHQKNWMPLVKEGSLQFIYSVDPTRIVDEHGRTVGETAALAALDHLRGGSQAIAFDGGWLALTHEVSHLNGKSVYLHRFIWLDQTDTLQLATLPFYFVRLGIEFAAGLAWHPSGQDLIVSFGVHDAEAWIGTVSASDVRAALVEFKRDSVDHGASHRFKALVRPVAAEPPANEPKVDRRKAVHSAKSLPKTYCVVCPQLPDRRTAAEAHFRERGLDVELFAGVHGPTWGLATTKLRADGRRMSAGHVGLVLSHWLLWRMAAGRDDEEILIFEDDVVLGRNFEAQFWRSYAELPADWQFVFVGSLGQFPSERVSDRVGVVRYPYGTHAYLVKKSALPTLIETNQEARTHLDLQLIDNTLPRLRCYTFTPSLAEQRTQTGEWITSTGESA